MSNNNSSDDSSSNSENENSVESEESYEDRCIKEIFGLNNLDEEDDDYDIKLQELIKTAQISIEDIQKSEKNKVFSDNNILENIDNYYNHYCVNKVLEYIDDNYDKEYGINILRLLHGLPESPKIKSAFINGDLVSIDIKKLKEFFQFQFELEILEGDNFTFNHGNEDSEYLIPFLSLRTLLLFKESHIKPNKILYGLMNQSHQSSYNNSNNQSYSNESLKKVECLICQEIMTDPATLPCGHSGCLRCLRLSFGNGHKKCCYCNKRIDEKTRKELSISINLRDAISLVFPIEERKNKKQKIDENVLLKPIELSDGQWLSQLSYRDPRVGRYQKNLKLNEECESIMVDKLEATFLLNNNNNDNNSEQQYLTKYQIKMLLRRAGCIAEEDEVYDKIREISVEYLTNLKTKSLQISRNQSSPILTVDHIIAAKPLGVTMFGYGGNHSIRYIWSEWISLVSLQIQPKLTIDPKALSVLNDICTFVMTKIIEIAIEMSNSRLSNDDNNNSICDYLSATHFKVFNVGPLGCKDNSYTVKLYYNIESVRSNDVIQLENSVNCVTVQDIETAISLCLNGKLCKHALSEGKKYVSEYNYNLLNNIDSPMDYATKGCTFRLECVVALLISRVTRDYPVSVSAAVFLTAAIEYIVAELIELSYSKADDRSYINSRDIMLAIKGDEDLNKLFSSCYIRDSGVDPYIHDAFENNIDTHKLTEFEDILVDKAKQASLDCFVDPRTGLHVYVVTTPNGSVEKLQPAPFLDAMSSDDVTDRLALARSLLSKAELKSMRSEGSLLLLDDNNNNNKWSDLGLKSVYCINLADIEYMQSTWEKVFDPVGFAQLTKGIGFEKCSGEALDCIQSYLEFYLLELCRESSLIARQSSEKVLSSSDISLAKTIRKDKC